MGILIKGKEIRQLILPRFLMGIIVMIVINQCTVLEIQNTSAGTDRVLVSGERECQAIEKRHWTILYGTVPIPFLNSKPEELLEGKTFRFKEKVGVVDFIISILGGLSTSITTKTIVIENCDADKIQKPQEAPVSVEGKKE